MGIINIFTREAPTIAGYSFDAILEDTLEITVQVTTYPIESGLRVADGRILDPFKWSLTGAISNNPLKTQLTDFIGGALSNLTDNPLVATVAGMSAGFLAGSDETKASAALDFLIELTRYGEPFDINAGDILLKNMVITKLSRTKDAANEGGLVFVAELQEMITLDRISSILQPDQSELRNEDPTKSALSRAIDKGKQVAKDVNKAVSDKVSSIAESIF